MKENDEIVDKPIEPELPERLNIMTEYEWNHDMKMIFGDNKMNSNVSNDVYIMRNLR